jgi:ABC-2 type transport system permease protein
VFDFAIIIIPFLGIVYGIFIGLGLLKIQILQFISNILFFILFSIVAGLINNAVSYFVGMLVFYTDHLFGLNMARNALQGFLGGQMVPLAYMGTLGVVFSFTPFAFMNSVPVLTIMGKLHFREIIIYLCIALLWILLIELANHFIFKRALQKITVQGG